MSNIFSNNDNTNATQVYEYENPIISTKDQIQREIDNLENEVVFKDTTNQSIAGTKTFTGKLRGTYTVQYADDVATKNYVDSQVAGATPGDEFVDLSSNQNIAGIKTFTEQIRVPDIPDNNDCAVNFGYTENRYLVKASGGTDQTIQNKVIVNDTLQVANEAVDNTDVPNKLYLDNNYYTQGESDGRYVGLDKTETITGTKTFNDNIVVNRPNALYIAGSDTASDDRRRIILANQEPTGPGSALGHSEGWTIDILAGKGESSGNPNAGNIAFYTTGNTSYVERMKIITNGNVGIGTSNPEQQLTVDGVIGVNNNKIVNLDDGTDATDAVNLGQVQSLVGGVGGITLRTSESGFTTINNSSFQTVDELNLTPAQMDVLGSRTGATYFININWIFSTSSSSNKGDFGFRFNIEDPANTLFSIPVFKVNNQGYSQKPVANEDDRMAIGSYTYMWDTTDGDLTYLKMFVQAISYESGDVGLSHDVKISVQKVEAQKY